MVKAVNSTVYEASDGEIFKNEERCKCYEETLLENGIKFRDELIAAIEDKETDWTPEFVHFIKSIPDHSARNIMRDVFNAKEAWDEENEWDHEAHEKDLLDEKDLDYF